MNKKPKLDRMRLRATTTDLEATITSLTQNRETGVVEISFLDAVLHADGRDHQVNCYDPAREVGATLYGFPIEILKVLDVARAGFIRENGGNGDIHLTLKNGAFSSTRIQSPGQDEREIDVKGLLND